jgi:hypothetical protein
MVSETKQPVPKPRRGTPARASEAPKGICTCGHDANHHVAFKYGCQAPGKRKGYCPCMRFIPRNEITGLPGMTEGPVKAD